jgi:hypothetical protein
MNVPEFLKIPPYSLERHGKETLFLQEINRLTQFHFDNCLDYRRLFQLLGLSLPPYDSLSHAPYLPVGLFKRHDLFSVSREQIFKVLHSSGTTSSIPSRIFLDRQTAYLQTIALSQIMTDFIGPQRLPLLIVDTEKIIQDRALFSARGAGVVGMLNFGRDPFYLLDDSLNVDQKGLSEWAEKHAGERVLIFGFTSFIWKHLLTIPQKISFPEGILIHGGGWKRLQHEGVTPQTFKEIVREITEIRYCHDFYGMVEQTGSIFMECQEGYLHCPNFSDVLIRTPSWQEASLGEVGVIQALSLLPHSYPGHSLLTDDLGSMKGIDDCACGRKGKYFQVIGRVPKAEPRGCSDVGPA